MKGIILEEHGPAESLQWKTNLPSKALSPDEVRVEVHYCALNHLDLWLRKGGTGDKLTLPRIPGSDVAGKVVEVGEAVAHLSVGASVVLYPGQGCGHCSSCSEGRDTLCSQFQIMGYHTDGGYAQHVTVKAENAIPISVESLREWSAVPVSYVTAWNALVTKAKLSVNDTVAIWGAAGGLGYAALSIAEGIGAKVIAIVGTDDKEEFLRKQGFTGDVLTRSDNVEQEIKKLTDRRGVDVVLDHVGKSTWNSSLRMLKKGGRLAFCGITTGAVVEMDLRYIFGKQLEIYGSWMGDRRDFYQVVNFLSKKERYPYIYREFPLEAAAEAQEVLESGQHVGKLILKNSLIGGEF
ncbi:zinc-binding dehydrogenase [Ammoniphilus sp. CFH 90114]|uniref:zinc-binding dehydrogenase n=1 Tax=Ammoniphilus sp. CFH 90114 TaxID=2493665 RepID=UPI0013E98320|nr:zinc-binding dehydrogenase [Ammoniphilus sp. CFH 90114]